MADSEGQPRPDVAHVVADLSSAEGVLKWAKEVRDGCLAPTVIVQHEGHNYLLPAFLFLKSPELALAFNLLVEPEWVDRTAVVLETLSTCMARLGPNASFALLFEAYYDLRCKQQDRSGQILHKGAELFNAGLCRHHEGREEAAIRLVTLALIEDVMHFASLEEVKGSNAYAFLAGVYGIETADRLAALAHDQRQKRGQVPFPEEVLYLCREHEDSIPPFPARVQYRVNRVLLEKLRGEADDPVARKTGKAWERLVLYLMSGIEGVQFWESRRLTRSSEIDLVFRIPEPTHPLSQIFGSYLIVEAKDWAKPIPAEHIRDFLGKLQSVECHTGLIVSRKGITGNTRRGVAGWLEIVKAYHRHRTIILVLDEKDIAGVQEGKNLVSILMRKYEEVRFDLFSASRSM